MNGCVRGWVQGACAGLCIGLGRGGLSPGGFCLSERVRCAFKHAVVCLPCGLCPCPNSDTILHHRDSLAHLNADRSGSPGWCSVRLQRARQAGLPTTGTRRRGRCQNIQKPSAHTPDLTLSLLNRLTPTRCATSKWKPPCLRRSHTSSTSPPRMCAWLCSIGEFLKSALNRAQLCLRRPVPDPSPPRPSPPA